MPHQSGAFPEHLYDIIILGAGPGGTTAAIYAARAGLRTIMVDKVHLGGQMVASERIANYPGYPEAISGRELLAAMRKQAQQHGAEFLVSEVLEVDLGGEIKKAFCYHGEYQARALIIATGAGERKSKIPGEEEFLGRGVSYCATCDGPFFKGEEVAVVGDSEEAAQEALFLAQLARRVHLLLPKGGLRASPDLVRQAQETPQLVFHPHQRVKRVVGSGTVSGVECQGQDGSITLLPVKGIFFYLLGAMPATGFLRGALALDENGYVVVDENMGTSVPGVYAVGDVRRGVLKQIVTAAADGAVAAMAAESYIRQRPRPLRTSR
jgi:thioredoxin reductase (NADPH)